MCPKASSLSWQAAVCFLSANIAVKIATKTGGIILKSPIMQRTNPALLHASVLKLPSLAWVDTDFMGEGLRMNINSASPNAEISI